MEGIRIRECLCVPEDELAWAAAWLYRATGLRRYLEYVQRNEAAIGGTQQMHTEMSWDQTLPGAQLLLAQALWAGLPASIQGSAAIMGVVEGYAGMAEVYACAHMPANPLRAVYTTPSGLLYVRGSNAQLALSSAFLLALLADFLAAAARSLDCQGVSFSPSQITAFAQSQVDYLLGSNPLAVSFMVGFGTAFPQKVHHRAASIISFNTDPSPVTCQGGNTTYLQSASPNPNVLVGAIVGGPNATDGFLDSRLHPAFTEPSAAANAVAVGLLARLAAGALPLASPSPPSPPAPRSPPPPKGKRPPPPKSTIPRAPPAPVSAPLSLVNVTCAVTGSWQQYGEQQNMWSCDVCNTNASFAVRDVALACFNFEPFNAWNFEVVSCSLPSWAQYIPGGGKRNFGFIQSARLKPSFKATWVTWLGPPLPPPRKPRSASCIPPSTFWGKLQCQVLSMGCCMQLSAPPAPSAT
ncbi:unnamed protein product [Closterium sp. NIES-65]|nr:unnamed protein product [Closterium sp. NIES-65]